MLLPAGLGVAGGALAARVAALEGFLVPLSVGFLGLGYYLAYWRNLGSGQQRLALWVATPLSLLFWMLPFVTK